MTLADEGLMMMMMMMMMMIMMMMMTVPCTGLDLQKISP